MKPTSHLTIDSTKSDPRKLDILEGVIYGTERTEARLPYPWEVVDLFQNDPSLGIREDPELPDNNLIDRGKDYSSNTQYRTIENSGMRSEEAATIWEAVKVSTASPPIHLTSGSNPELIPGVEYTVSLWHKSPTPDARFYMGLYETDNGFLTDYPFDKTTTEWSLRQLTFRIPTSYSGVGITIYLYPFGTTQSPINTVAYFTSPKLEYGPVATPRPKPSSDVWGYRDATYGTGQDLRGYVDEGIYRIHERTNLKEQGVGLYDL